MLKFQHILQIIIPIFLVNLRFNYAVDLNVNINIQNKNKISDPNSLTYYWPQQASDSLPRTLNLLLTLSIQSVNQSVQLSQPASITIVCSQTPTSTSNSNFASLTFTDKVINSLSITANVEVQFTINKNGQPPLVSCTGQVNSFTNQNVLGYQLTNLKFIDSSYTQMIIQPYPTISFKKIQESASNFEISPFSDSYFEIFFRDQLQYNATLTCSITPNRNVMNFVPGGSTSVTSGYVGFTSIRISYSINLANFQIGNSFRINCAAESNGITGIDQQYQSTFASAIATITFKNPKIDFQSQTNLRILGSNFQIPLKLNPTKRISGNVTVECDLRRFSTLNELTTFQTTISPTICPTNLPTSNSVNLSDYSYNGQSFDWYFIDKKNNSIITKLKQFKFDNSELIDFIEIGRRPLNSIKSNLNVYLSLFCCDKSILSTDPTNVPKYQSAVAAISIMVSPSSNPNLTFPTAPSDNDLLDPNYSPCTCDLTVGACDIDCCCDSDCKDDDKKAANLRCETRVRTIFEKTIDKWTCNDIYNNPKKIENDWFPIICIHLNTTVLLGNFYSPKVLNDLISNQNEKFVQIVESSIQASYNIRSKYLNDPYTSNQETITTSSFCSLDLTKTSNYIYGWCLKLADSDSPTAVTDFFRFPQSSKNFASCYYDSPIRFLSTEGRIFCPTTIKPSCPANSQFDYKTYLDKLLISDLINGETIKVSTDTNFVEFYKCTNFLSGSDPSTTAGATAFECVFGTDKCTFDPNTKLFDYDTSSCNNNSWIVSSTGKDVVTDYYLKPDSTLSNCKLINFVPSDVSLTSGTNKCSNVVVGVKHIFFWNGGVIEKLLTRIILNENVNFDPSGSGSKEIKQMFEIKWVYTPNITSDVLDISALTSVSQYDDLITSSKYIENLRSGKKGYEIGKPIISGYRKKPENKTDISYNLRFSTYKILNGKLCGTLSKLERQLILFGKNTSSSCVVQVTKNDLTNSATCYCLRNIIFNKLNDYFAPSNVISKNGNPNMVSFSEKDWLDVYPSDRKIQNFTISNSSTDQILNGCKNVPFKINLWFFYADVGKSSGEKIKEIIGTYVSYSYRDWVYTQNQNSAQDFTIEFEANFIDQTQKASTTWFDRCKNDKYPSESCLEEVFWTWPKDYNDENFFYLYTVHLGLLFGIFSLITVYFMIFGFLCPC